MPNELAAVSNFAADSAPGTHKKDGSTIQAPVTYTFAFQSTRILRSITIND
jgi:hypothetical protein